MASYKFGSNFDLCLTGDLREVLPGVIAYGIQFDLNLYTASTKWSPRSARKMVRMPPGGGGVIVW